MYDSPDLKDIPNIISSEDCAKLKSSVMLRTRQATILYEGMITRYGELPYLLVRLAELRTALGSPVLAASLFTQAHRVLSQSGIDDTQLDFYMKGFVRETFANAEGLYKSSLKVHYYQSWKESKELGFPHEISILPPGHEQVKMDWSSSTSTPDFYTKYLRLMAIETNHIEDTFLLMTESTHDIVRQGPSHAKIVTEYDSEIHENDIIKSVLHDTLEAYEAMLPLAREPEHLTRSAICRIHSLLMETCRYDNSHGRYIPPGKTRTETMQTVIVGGSHPIQCCPYARVDNEFDYICKISKHWIDACDNPFSVSSWLHLVLARCHPFDDGNGRLTRIIASIPLIRAGYPPISLSLTQRPSYFQAINEAYNGDYALLIECFMQGMKATIETVKGL